MTVVCFWKGMRKSQRRKPALYSVILQSVCGGCFIFSSYTPQYGVHLVVGAICHLILGFWLNYRIILYFIPDSPHRLPEFIVIQDVHL
jgi:heme A synthase